MSQPSTIKKILQAPIILILAAILSLISTSVIYSGKVSAQGQQAQQYCGDQYPGGDGNSAQRREACRKGYNAGKNNGNKNDTCKDYNGNIKDACEKGFNKGKSDASGSGGGSGGGSTSGGDKCGTGDKAVKTKFNLGCNGADENPIIDMFYALVRFLSAGVGVVVVIMIIWAGIRYASSEGNPETTARAKNHIQMALIALLIYIFAFALVNYLVPGGFLT